MMTRAETRCERRETMTRICTMGFGNFGTMGFTDCNIQSGTRIRDFEGVDFTIEGVQMTGDTRDTCKSIYGREMVKARVARKGWHRTKDLCEVVIVIWTKADSVNM